MKIIFFVLLFSVSMLAGASDTKTKVLKKGDKCPAFVFKNMEGQDMILGQFEGKYVVVDIWATWCQPCKSEFPYLQKLEEKYKDKNIVFVSISCDSQERRWRFGLSFLNERIKLQWWYNNNEDFMKAFKVAMLPRLLLIDKKGFVVNTEMPKPSDPEFDEIIGKLKGL